MPLLFETEATRGARVRVFVRAQLPFLVSVAFVVAFVAVGSPASFGAPILLLGFGVAVLASVAALVVPWERLASSWMLTVAIADIVAVAFIRAELLAVIPSASMLAIFPILWLAYGFHRSAILVAVVGSGFITSFTFAYHGTMPSSPIEWVNVVTLPTLIICVAIVVNIAAEQLRRNRRHLVRAHEAESAALRRALDNEILAGTILNTVRAAVVFYDASGRLVVANRLAGEMSAAMGIRLDQPPYFGVDVLAADRVTAIPAEEQIIPRALRGENVDDQVEWVGPPDLQRAISSSARRVHREGGERIGTVVVAHDVTELMVAVDVREQFLRTVSHELRTPMTNIMGYLDLIDERLPETDATGHGYATTVLRNADALMDRIRELSAAASVPASPTPRRTDLVELTDEVLGELRERAARRGITLEHAGPSSLWADIDPSMVRQAVRELLTNAIKFADPHSAVTVARRRTDDRCAISVSNAGPVITRGELRHIFDRFYRTAYARENAIQGFGIGLTLVKQVADAHAGRVHVERSPEERTVFTLELPVSRATE
ncbi:PAS domain-containing sensor histidine kinase [Microbacterium sp. 18062]|uniref:PAS domain-containing sensor histidine kinase n=1 Tax=Microbacterium sp. 18062 TaxID=2681410 RepID=UPI001359ECFA|nr:PAS domain-containing sensor histidine kinase [Microbacterium sp. 18062]